MKLELIPCVLRRKHLYPEEMEENDYGNKSSPPGAENGVNPRFQRSVYMFVVTCLNFLVKTCSNKYVTSKMPPFIRFPSTVTGVSCKVATLTFSKSLLLPLGRGFAAAVNDAAERHYFIRRPKLPDFFSTIPSPFCALFLFCFLSNFPSPISC